LKINTSPQLFPQSRPPLRRWPDAAIRPAEPFPNLSPAVTNLDLARINPPVRNAQPFPLHFGQGQSQPESPTLRRRFNQAKDTLFNQFRFIVRWVESCYANIKMGFVVSACILTFLPIPAFARRYIERKAFFAPILSSDLGLVKDKKLRAKISEHYFNLLTQFEGERMTLKSAGVVCSADHDNVRLNGWLINAKPGKPTVLFHHGRASNISTLEKVLKVISDRDYGVFVYDYPGFGKSEGQPDEESVCNAGLAATKYLQKTLHIPQSQQVMMGYSLGTAVATDVANKLTRLGQPPKALVLVNAFPSIKSTFLYRQRHDYPGTKKWFDADKIKLRFDTESKLKQLPNLPLMILQGEKDKDTPIPMLREMLQRIGRPVSALEPLKDAKHRLNEDNYPLVGKHFSQFMKREFPQSG